MTSRAIATWSYDPWRYEKVATDAEREKRDASARAFFERYRLQLLQHVPADTLVLEVPR